MSYQLVTGHLLAKVSTAKQLGAPIARRLTRLAGYGLVPVTHAWVEVRLGGGWVAAFRLVPQEGTPVIAELRIFPAEPKRLGYGEEAGEWSGQFLGLGAGVPLGGLTASLLRQIPVGAPLSFADELVRRMNSVFGAEGVPEYTLSGGRWKPRRPRRRGGILERGPNLVKMVAKSREPLERFAARRGRPPRPDSLLVSVAADYVNALARQSRRPIVEVAAQRQLTVGQVRDTIHDARKRGFLTPAARQGRRGGGLTPLARAHLAALRRPRGKLGGKHAAKLRRPR